MMVLRFYGIIKFGPKMINRTSHLMESKKHLIPLILVWQFACAVSPVFAANGQTTSCDFVGLGSSEKLTDKNLVSPIYKKTFLKYGINVDKMITRQQIEADFAHLNALFAVITQGQKEQDSWNKIFATAASNTPAQSSINDFGHYLKKVLSYSNHKALEEDAVKLPPGYLPFLLADSNGGVLALHKDRKSFLDSEFPLLLEVDGEPLQVWVIAAQKNTASTSPQSKRARVLNSLSAINFLRMERQKKVSQSVSITLASLDKKKTKKLSLNLSEHVVKASFRKHAPLTMNIGSDLLFTKWTKLHSHAEEVDAIYSALRRSGSYKGVIVDLREVDGYNKHFIEGVLPYFLPEQVHFEPLAFAKPHKSLNAVCSQNKMDAYESGFSKISQLNLTAADQQVLKNNIIKQRNNDNQNPSTESLIWAGKNTTLKPQIKVPVVFLINEQTRGDIEIFLAAIKGRTNVTIVGSPSAGEVTQMVNYRLPNSGFIVRAPKYQLLSSKQQQIEGFGVLPDIQVRPEPLDRIGKSDALLQMAVKILRQ